MKRLDEREEHRTIVAIGGGEIANGETRAIDEYIVSLSEALCPKMLVILTASFDNFDYASAMCVAFEKLGCTTEVLYLCQTQESNEQLREQILTADIVYIGGGDTEAMLDIWRAHGVDQALLEAWNNGVIISGISAGALCWFEAGVTDRVENDNAYLVWMNGLGVIPMNLGPHYSDAFWQGYDRFLAERNAYGLALENNVALCWRDGHAYVIHGDDHHKAWRIFPNGEKREYDGGRF